MTHEASRAIAHLLIMGREYMIKRGEKDKGDAMLETAKQALWLSLPPPASALIEADFRGNIHGDVTP
jgi:hypothetical protein